MYLQSEAWRMLNLRRVGISTMDPISICDNGKLMIRLHELQCQNVATENRRGHKGSFFKASEVGGIKRVCFELAPC